MTEPITIEENIEQALDTLLMAAMNTAGFGWPLNIVTTVYDTQDADRSVDYPCVVFACSPFASDTPGSILGYCQLTVSCMTEQNDDKFGSVVNQVAGFIFPLVVKDSVGPLVYSPWLLCGINDTGTTEVSVDEDANLNIRTREFSIALARVSA